MLKSEQIPMEVQDALNKAHGFFVSPRALAAAINAWPGAHKWDTGQVWHQAAIVLPLPKENSHDPL